MILKSFYRKKITKIYLAILVLIACVFGAILIGKNKYIEELNKNYDESFIYFESSNNIVFEGIENIKTAEKSTYLGIFYYMLSDKNLGDNEVLIPSFLKNSYSMNSIIEDGNFTFTVKDYYDMSYMSPILYVNSNTFEKLLREENKIGYIVRVDNWNKSTDVMKYLESTYNAEARSFEINKANIDYSELIDNFTTYSYIIIAIFALVSIITIYNILHDQKEKEYLYRSLGYSKKKVMILEILNIVSLYLFSMVLSIIIILLINVFLW